MNHLKTFILLAALTALFAGLGYLVGGVTGMVLILRSKRPAWRSPCCSRAG